MRLMLLLTFAIVVSSCSSRGLKIADDGWVYFEGAAIPASLTSEVEGRFVRHNSCVLFELADGARIIPILPQGQRFALEPARSLYESKWLLRGIDTQSESVVALRNDPVARICEGTPAFIGDIVPLRAPPPPFS